MKRVEVLSILLVLVVVIGVGLIASLDPVLFSPNICDSVENVNPESQYSNFNEDGLVRPDIVRCKRPKGVIGQNSLPDLVASDPLAISSSCLDTRVESQGTSIVNGSICNLTLVYDLKNEGGSAYGVDYLVEIEKIGGPKYIASSASLINIPSSGSYRIRLKLNDFQIPNGTYSASVFIDPENKILESNENNNNKTSNLFLLPRPKMRDFSFFPDFLFRNGEYNYYITYGPNASPTEIASAFDLNLFLEQYGSSVYGLPPAVDVIKPQEEIDLYTLLEEGKSLIAIGRFDNNIFIQEYYSELNLGNLAGGLLFIDSEDMGDQDTVYYVIITGQSASDVSAATEYLIGGENLEGNTIYI